MPSSLNDGVPHIEELKEEENPIAVLAVEEPLVKEQLVYEGLVEEPSAAAAGHKDSLATESQEF